MMLLQLDDAHAHALERMRPTSKEDFVCMLDVDKSVRTATVFTVSKHHIHTAAAPSPHAGLLPK